MIIPLGHEQTSVRRVPWVTFAIMAVCVVTFVLMAPGEHTIEMTSFLRLHQAVGYFTQHPYLEVDQRFQAIFALQMGVDQAAAFTEYMRKIGPRAPQNPRRLEWEQNRFNAMVAAYYEGLKASMLYRFGLVPADPQGANLITYQFLHTGWLHLLFNLLMLFVIAPFIEDVWGRPLFTAFYLAAGAFAGIMFGVRYPGLEMPLVGASGAIAGVMGAFLVRYFRSKIRFLIWLGVPVGPFHAPAWMVLPMWFAIQLASAQFMEAALPEGGSGAVAFWAHVWGFGFGAVAAYAMMHFRIEERYIHPAIESKVTVVDNVAVERAVARAGKGDIHGAVAALEHQLDAEPDNVDAAMALWNMAAAQGQPQRALEPILRTVAAAVRRGDDEFVISQWEEVLNHVPESPVDPLLAVRIAEILEEAQRVVSAIETLELARRRIEPQTPAAVLLRVAKLGLAIEAPSAEAMVRTALEHPDTPRDARPELEVALWSFSKRQPEQRSAAGTFGRTAPQFPPGADKIPGIQVTEAVPFAFDQHHLTVDCTGIFRQIDLRDIKAIAAAVLARDGRKPVALLDLLLEQPGKHSGDLNTIRIFSDSFDPRTLVGGDDHMSGFKTFVTRVLDTSLAAPLPDWEAVRGQPFRSYPSLAEYQRQVLGVTG